MGWPKERCPNARTAIPVIIESVTEGLFDDDDFDGDEEVVLSKDANFLNNDFKTFFNALKFFSSASQIVRATYIKRSIFFLGSTNFVEFFIEKILKNCHFLEHS